jgi:AcrR family transcriptional regulator
MGRLVARGAFDHRVRRRLRVVGDGDLAALGLLRDRDVQGEHAGVVAGLEPVGVEAVAHHQLPGEGTVGAVRRPELCLQLCLRIRALSPNSPGCATAAGLGYWHDGGVTDRETHVEVDGHPAASVGRRGRGLSRGRIARAALVLIDEQGVGAASMRTIAGRLGVEAMSLYKHFRTRDELLDAVVDLIVDELDADPEVLRTAKDGWRDYLTRLAYGVRAYALAHPHAFPLVATRPAEAPWVNPPLRSLAWIENLLATLADAGFDAEQILFAYRSFNSFLLGYLLMETGAKTLRDPQEGDGSYGADGAADPEPVPGGLTPTRTDEQAEAIADADMPRDLLDPQDDIDPAEYPVIHRLARELAQDHYGEEFDRALGDMLDRIATHLH